MSNYQLPTTNYKLLVLVGPTSSGKSELAVKLAKRFHGEIISCDSRQIYKGMDIGTGKVEGKWKRLKNNGRENSAVFVYKNIAHHLIDFVSPKKQYSAALFKSQAQKIISDIIQRGKLPILCGGTGHWIDAVVFNQDLPDVGPNPKLRAKLEKKSANNLYEQLRKLDSRRASTIDRHNKRRLIRALEIVITTGKPVPHEAWSMEHEAYDTLWVGINPKQKILNAKIKKRLKQRLDQGMIKEVARLHRSGISWKRLVDFGLEYKFVSLYLQKKLNEQQMFEQLLIAIQHYAKRQMTWWKRNNRINWTNSTPDAVKIAKNFLN